MLTQIVELSGDLAGGAWRRTKAAMVILLGLVAASDRGQTYDIGMMDGESHAAQACGDFSCGCVGYSRLMGSDERGDSHLSNHTVASWSIQVLRNTVAALSKPPATAVIAARCTISTLALFI